jgi:hypothetical protein
VQLKLDRQKVKLFGVWDNQRTKFPIGPTFALALRQAAAFLCWLRFECDDMKDQFVQLFIAGRGQNAHPAAHPAIHVFGSNRKAANRHPKQSRASQVLESRRGFFAAFAERAGRFGRLFAPVMMHTQDAPINDTQFDTRTLNRGLIQVHFLSLTHLPVAVSR